MSNTDDTRWRQRFENFSKIYLKLEQHITVKPWREYGELEQAGIVQLFEITYDLAWKTLKDWLFAQGYDEKTPKAVIRRGFEVELLSEEDAECFLKLIKERNLTSHTYNPKTAEMVLNNIGNDYVPMFRRLHKTLKDKQNG